MSLLFFFNPSAEDFSWRKKETGKNNCVRIFQKSSPKLFPINLVDIKQGKKILFKRSNLKMKNENEENVSQDEIMNRDNLGFNYVSEIQNRRIPIVTVVGRGNVGKSTLVNRLAGSFTDGSIVADMIGVTRDKTYKKAFWRDYEYIITDTGGFLFGDQKKQPFSEEVIEQAIFSIQEANVIIFLIDGLCELTSDDLELARYLKFQKSPVLLAVNKCENLQKFELESSKYFSLGLGEPVPISAIHGTNTGELLDKLVSKIPKITIPYKDNIVKVAIVGKPNAGKSSILNFLTGKKRAIVSEIPGTTRDPIDSFVSGGPNCNIYNFIDTAGIRKKKAIEYGPEFFMINRAFKVIQKCDCVLLVIDASIGITDQDRKLSERIEQEGKSCVILFNKWDLVPFENSKNFREEKALLETSLPSVSWATALFTSAKDGTRCNKILEAIDSAVAQFNRHVSTSIHNEIIQEAIRWRPPPSTKSGKQGKIYYCTQISERPPTIAIFVNDPSLFNESYTRFIEGQFRDALGFEGTSLKLLWTKKR